MAKVRTVQLARHRLATSFGYVVVNTTAGSNASHFLSPSWELVEGYKSGTLDNRQYRDAYIKLMRKSYVERKEEWLSLLRKPRFAVACYCKSGVFCHRLIAVELLQAVANKHNIPFEYEGEIEVRNG
jgi:hypothetical protein